MRGEEKGREGEETRLLEGGEGREEGGERGEERGEREAGGRGFVSFVVSGRGFVSEVEEEYEYVVDLRGGEREGGENGSLFEEEREEEEEEEEEEEVGGGERGREKKSLFSFSVPTRMRGEFEIFLSFGIKRDL